jgi:hypothetical protein
LRSVHFPESVDFTDRLAVHSGSVGTISVDESNSRFHIHEYFLIRVIDNSSIRHFGGNHDIVTRHHLRKPGELGFSRLTLMAQIGTGVAIDRNIQFAFFRMFSSPVGGISLPLRFSNMLQSAL